MLIKNNEELIEVNEFNKIIHESKKASVFLEKDIASLGESAKRFFERNKKVSHEHKK